MTIAEHQSAVTFPPEQEFSSGPHLVWMAMPDGQVHYLNRRAQAFYGIDSLHTANETWQQRIHPEDQPAVMAAWQRALKDGTRYRHEYRVLGDDGHYRHCLSQALPVRDGNGEILRWLGATTDVEPYYQRLESARVIELCYRTLVGGVLPPAQDNSAPVPEPTSLDFRQFIEFMPQLVWSSGPDGLVDFVNQRWRDFTDMPAHKAAAYGWMAAAHPQDQTDLKTSWQTMMARQTAFRLEFRLRRHDGSYRRCDLRAEPLYDSAGRVHRWIGAVTDVEERHRLFSSLQESESRLQDLLHHLPELFLLYDSAGLLLDANQFACERLGYPRAALLRQPISSLRSAPPDMVQMPSPVRPGETARQRWVLHCRDGQRFLAETSTGSHLLAGSQVFFMLARDVSAEETADAQLREQARLIEHAPVSVSNIDGRVELWSSGAERIFGYTAAEALGQPIQDLLQVELPRPAREFLQLLRHQRSVVEEAQAVHRNGQRLRVRAQWALSGEAGNRRILVTYTDVTPQREAEAQARAAEQALLAALAQGSAGTWSWDLQTDRVVYDYAAQRLLGLEASALPRSVERALSLQLLLPAERVEIEQRIADARRDGCSCEFVFQIPIGAATRWLLTRGGPTAEAHTWAGVIVDVTGRQQSRAALQASQQQLRAYAHQLNQTLEQERAHLARELHDELGQRMTALRLDLRWLERQLPQDTRELAPIGARFAAMDSLIDQTLTQVRHLSTSLRPQELEGLGLKAAIEAHVAQLERRAGIRCKLKLASCEALGAEHQLTVFRVFQEALTNGIRHGQATQFTVRLNQSRRTLKLQIDDNGTGLSQARSQAGVGVIGMTERAYQLGGSLALASRPQGGTSLTLKLPWTAPRT